MDTLPTLVAYSPPVQSGGSCCLRVALGGWLTVRPTNCRSGKPWVLVE